jgi:hypothetical protein
VKKRNEIERKNVAISEIEKKVITRDGHFVKYILHPFLKKSFQTFKTPL